MPFGARMRLRPSTSTQRDWYIVEHPPNSKYIIQGGALGGKMDQELPRLLKLARVGAESFTFMYFSSKRRTQILFYFKENKSQGKVNTDSDF